jgi:hypothetical protein
MRQKDHPIRQKERYQKEPEIKRENDKKHFVQGFFHLDRLIIAEECRLHPNYASGFASPDDFGIQEHPCSSTGLPTE